MSNESMLAKFSAAHSEMATIRDFLEWLDGQKFGVAAWGSDGNRMLPIIEDRERLLMRYLGLDPVKLESERRALLAKFNVAADDRTRR